MSKRFTTAYTIFSLIVFIFLIVWFVFRAINTRTTNMLEIEDELAGIAKTVSSSYLAAGSFGSGYFSDQIAKKVSDSPELRALVVSSTGEGVVYLYAINRLYLPQYTGSPESIPIPVDYSYNAIAEEHVATTVPVPSLGNIRLDAVYTVFGRTEVFPIIREMLIGLLSFLLITAILTILYPAIARKSAQIENFVAESEPNVPTTKEQPFAEQAFPDRQEIPTQPRSIIPAGVDTSGLYSPTTGLGWERHLVERLSAELKRAASFDQDLVLLLGSISGMRNSAPEFSTFADSAREFFNFQDLCFEYGKSGIGIIIPNVDIDQGIERAELFKSKADSLLSQVSHRIRFSIGLSARNSRLISGSRIIREAKSGLKRAVSEPSGIIAFRVDPEKYREYIASQSVSSRS